MVFTDPPYNVPIAGHVQGRGRRRGIYSCLMSGNDLQAAYIGTVGGTDHGETILGTSVADKIWGLGGNDIIAGYGGDDTIVGGAGADTFVSGRGHGHDVVLNQGQAGEGDRVYFGSTIAHDQLWFNRQGDDLVIDVMGTQDGVTVDDWFSSDANRVDSIQTAAGDRLAVADVNKLVTAMAAMAPPAAGQTSLDA